MKVESLQKPIVDGDGQISELGDLIADDKALDLADWTDIKTFLLGCPQRLIDIAEKIRSGEALTNTEDHYLKYQRQKLSKKSQKLLQF